WGQLGRPGPQGQPQGFQALEAQAVAARSYAMAVRGQYGYADICDSAGCQVYLGLAGENPITDRAVADTAGEVRVLATGGPALTEYSSSSGGYTAGGTFPAVVDSGDAVCVPQSCNPTHDWTATVPVSAIEADWPSIGAFESIRVTSRNGPGDYGGRVEELILVGSAGHLDLSGSSFASALGLKSDWFEVQGAPAGGLSGYRVGDTAGRVYDFGTAADHGSVPARAHIAPLVGMAGTPGGTGYWMLTSQGNVYNLGDAGWYGSTAEARLAQPIVGMASTPDGKGYWLVARDGGVFTFGDARFYGSTGAIHLAQPIVGMAATPDGRGYWLVAADGGIFTFGDAAYLGSLPGSGVQTTATAMLATPTGRGYMVLTRSGKVYGYGDAPNLGDVVEAQPSYRGVTLGIVGVQGH
ncbi:MAG: SpoIID/LytB domain-containing protein, partial [Acidimicrobiales bacterium]